MKWPLAVGALLVMLSAACTERFTTPGDCPTFCPGGQAVFRDTVLIPVANADSSFTGFVDNSTVTSLLASSGGSYGQHLAVIRFLGRGDSVSVSDTNHTFSIDSVVIELGLQDRDTTSTNFVFQIYRLPLSIDTTSSFADVQAAMTPANEIAEVPEGPAFRTGLFHIDFSGDSLNRVAFAASDSGVLQIGIRVKADQPTAARIGSPNSGADGPLLTTYVEANGVPDSLKIQTIGLISEEFFTASPPAPPPSTSLLAVGGFPVSRSFIRFSLPPFLRDSATIIRATLTLTADAPVVGIPGDTATVVAFPLLVDFGAKSPVITAAGGSVVMLPGDSVAVLEVAPLVQSWQGTNPSPPIVRLNLGQEGASFIAPLFHSTRSPSGAPVLRITYRPPFAFQGY